MRPQELAGALLVLAAWALTVALMHRASQTTGRHRRDERAPRRRSQEVLSGSIRALLLVARRERQESAAATYGVAGESYGGGHVRTLGGGQ